MTRVGAASGDVTCGGAASQGVTGGWAASGGVTCGGAASGDVTGGMEAQVAAHVAEQEAAKADAAALATRTA